MPSINAFYWLFLPIALAALVYQFGPQAFVSEQYCYKSVRTLSSEESDVHCFTVHDGKFSSVYSGDAASEETKEARTGYVSYLQLD